MLDTNGYFSKVDIHTDIPDFLMIYADMDRLFGVFDSLLSNAVNFSRPPREITIVYNSESMTTITTFQCRIMEQE